jgi:hypothetical protein
MPDLRLSERSSRKKRYFARLMAYLFQLYKTVINHTVQVLKLIDWDEWTLWLLRRAVERPIIHIAKCSTLTFPNALFLLQFLICHTKNCIIACLITRTYLGCVCPSFLVLRLKGHRGCSASTDHRLIKPFQEPKSVNTTNKGYSGEPSASQPLYIAREISKSFPQNVALW